MAGEQTLGSHRLALCHEWLDGRSGSEKTFECMAEVFPEADLYALTWNREAKLSLGDRNVSTTFLDRLAFLRSRKLQLPLMPLAWRIVTRRKYDVVVTSSHACSKGFWPGRKALHLCYCYTPMRYVWLSSIDRRHGATMLTAPLVSALKAWDLKSAHWVDEFAAISSAVMRRIERVYSRPARVIHPPVATQFFTPNGHQLRGDFALAVSRMVPYKRLDLAIKACAQVGYPLVIAGSGPQEDRLRALAHRLGHSVDFLISPDDGTLLEMYRSCRALIFPAEEDFGIVPVEAQACGTPVVALAQGGAVDTVRDGVTGVLVKGQDVEHLAQGLETVLTANFNPGDCRSNAERFSTLRFKEEFRGWVLEAAEAHGC